MAAAWPGRAGDPFADHMNGIPKYVVTGTLGDDDLTWNNTTRIPGDGAIARLGELRAADGGDCWSWAARRSSRTLIGEGLVDELRLVRMPVILGGGKSIFPADGTKQTLELVSAVTSEAGAQVCTYRPVAAP